MKYRVNLAKTIWLSVDVEAEDEDSAIDAAHEHAPSMCAHCVGWGKQWSVSDDDEWRSIEEFHGERYNEKHHGKTVEPA